MDVQVFHPHGVPVGDPELSDHRKVVEVRALLACSEAHLWSAAEFLDNICSWFKNQIE